MTMVSLELKCSATHTYRGTGSDWSLSPWQENLSNTFKTSSTASQQSLRALSPTALLSVVEVAALSCDRKMVLAPHSNHSPWKAAMLRKSYWPLISW